VLSHLQKERLRSESLCGRNEEVPIELHIGDASIDERFLGEESLLSKDEGLRVLAEEFKYEEKIHRIQTFSNRQKVSDNDDEGEGRNSRLNIKSGQVNQGHGEAFGIIHP
jgi:hypothetical protein